MWSFRSRSAPPGPHAELLAGFVRAGVGRAVLVADVTDPQLCPECRAADGYLYTVSDLSARSGLPHTCSCGPEATCGPCACTFVPVLDD